MNEKDIAVASTLVPKSFLIQAKSAQKRRSALLSTLLSQRALPEHGWDEATIEWVIEELAAMDSNNAIGQAGVGEREGRIACPIVARRHFRLCHGIGRSGDLLAAQPKAAGSSLYSAICQHLALAAVKIAGVVDAKACAVLPVATGMSLVLCMIALRENRPKAKYVVWSRIDQKSCFKSMITAGFEPIVVELRRDGDCLRTDVEKIESEISRVGVEHVLCVLCTTSCFAPRVPDSVVELAKLCKRLDVPHIVNNAYGLQSARNCAQISRAIRCGRIDAFVQSADKNFMVPVGGAIVAGPNKTFIQHVARSYPGRASGTPTLDLFITLLHWGKRGYDEILARRSELFPFCCERLREVAHQCGERVLDTAENEISMSMTLDNLVSLRRKSLKEGSGDISDSKLASLIGSMLYTRMCSGNRVVPRFESKSIAGYEFIGWGSHTDDYGASYLTIACAIGLTRVEFERFIERLQRVLKDFVKGS